MGGQTPLVLILTNAQDATTDFFETRLASCGVTYRRLNTELLGRYPFALSVSGEGTHLGIDLDGRVEVKDIASIYYRRPVLPTVGGAWSEGVTRWVQDEIRSAWGGLLSSLQRVKWVNHPLAISGASYKPEQLSRAARLGLHVPDTLVTSDANAAERFCRERHFDVVTKPIGRGEVREDTPENDCLVYTNKLTEENARPWHDVEACPTLFQSHVTKALDLRVTVVDYRCFAVALHSQEQESSRVDCRRNNMSGMRYSVTALPVHLESKLVELTSSYGLVFSAIDLAVDLRGEYWFFELNPSGQWAWLEQVTGVPISEALIRSLVAY